MKALLASAWIFAAVALPGAFAAAPPNDNFANAQALSGNSGSGDGTTVDATIEASEPSHGGYPAAGSVWYVWTAPAAGVFVFTKQDPYGPDVGVYSGTAVNALTEIGNGSSADVNRYTFQTKQGVAYYISINIGGSGATFSYSYAFHAAPPNDNFADAQPISGASGSVTGNVAAATLESGEPHTENGGSIWFVWTAPSTGSFRFDAQGQINGYVIYTGQSLGSMTQVFGGNFVAGIPYAAGMRVQSGQQYYIQVSGTVSPSGDSTGDITLTWMPGPANDDFANAIPISGSEGSIKGNTRGATPESGERNISGWPPTESIWYEWTAPAAGWYTFSATNGASVSNFLLAAYTGSALTDLKVSSDNAAVYYGDGVTITVTFHADAGSVYHIAIALVQTYMNFSSRDITLSWRKGTSPADVALLNLSTRGRVGADADVLIGGFIIKGDSSKKVMIRAIGPSLNVAGTPVAGRLLDPMLELHDHTGAMVFSNDNWKESAQQQAIIDTGIPPGDDKESAIVATLAPGAYTAIVSGAGVTSGVALVELYDLDAASATRVANISTRGKVEGDGNVMIGGVIIGGSLPTKVAVRALGPSLADAKPPVADSLANPELRMFDHNGMVLWDNDDWNGTPDLQAIGLAPKNQKEAAFITTLAPGNYTVIVDGVGKTIGVGLVEIYNLD
ncbi:MAG: hypothetical protein ACJ8IQ_03855 [Chthoniobacterales bacterium]